MVNVSVKLDTLYIGVREASKLCTMRKCYSHYH